MATAAWVLWSRHLRFDPLAPGWPDRDRFVLSAGHGSALLYALLHLSRFDLPLAELRRFRQWGSATPGHPEFGHTPGVETTTGPLGQGIATAVGMALAERMAAARYNVAGEEPVVDHRTFVLCSDGDLMEGVSGEAASLAGHLGLGKLVVLYDDNGITIDGATSLAFTEDVCGRFAAYGWQVTRITDGEDVAGLEAALDEALADEQHPTFIAVRSTIGYGAPTKAGTSACHGAPLGAEELAATKARFGWPEEPFFVPGDVHAAFAGLARAGRARHRRWEAAFAGWARRHPELAAQWRRVGSRVLPEGVPADLPRFEEGTSLATRVASGRTLTALAERLPELVGGSADLAESTNVALPGSPVVPGGYGGRTIHFGVREHAMAAVANGLALHGGFRPVVSTFLVFSDYLRPALRLSALMGQPVVYVFTHDSIGLGEDGPTHQPVEHLAALRAIPNLAVLRPADARETAEAWTVALGRTAGPTALILSRQALPVLPGRPSGWMALRGARVVRNGDGPAGVALVATGSEVALCLAAADQLAERGVAARVVSMPWRERFEELHPADQDEVLPPGLPRLVVEAASPQGWQGVAGAAGRIWGLSRFGASAPGPVALGELGFSAEAVAAAALELAAAEPERNSVNDLRATAQAMVAPGKGILAADESNATITKRFEQLRIPSTPDTRRAYRELLLTTPKLGEWVSGVILYDETIHQSAEDGPPFPALLSDLGILPGIKVDTGAKPLAGHDGETVTEGLDGLRDRVRHYAELGARFAKWRAVITIGDVRPSPACVSANAHALARYAALCQEGGLVPIVEPEVVLDGDHPIERCGGVTGWMLRAVFAALVEQEVDLEAIVLKPNMVIAGTDAPRQAGVAEVAEATLECLRRAVPAAVPGVAFLSGGQSPEQATAHLRAMAAAGPHPWALTFSYGRALQDPALRAWGGREVAAGQVALAARARANAAASLGRDEPALEPVA